METAMLEKVEDLGESNTTPQKTSVPFFSLYWLLAKFHWHLASKKAEFQGLFSLGRK